VFLLLIPSFDRECPPKLKNKVSFAFQTFFFFEPKLTGIGVDSREIENSREVENVTDGEAANEKSAGIFCYG